MPEQREPGWYWVRWVIQQDAGNWGPCHWRGHGWEVPGFAMLRQDSDWSEIGPRILPPSVAPSQPQPVMLPKLTPEQREYFRDLKERHVSYDPKMVIGGPQPPQQQDMDVETVFEAEPGSSPAPAVAIIERARLAASAWYPGCVDDTHCTYDSEDCSCGIIARAVVAAMYHPPKALWEAWRSVNCNIGTDGMEEFTYFAGDYGNWLACHHAMLDAALSPLTGPVSNRTANNTDAYPNKASAPSPSGDRE